MSYPTNSEYLNRTANKSAGGPPWRFFLIHETASPNPSNPRGTLEYNLSPTVGSSYHDLVGRDGVDYQYLSPEQYVAWHGGKNTRVWVDGVQYDGGEVNSYSIGVEIDGKCDGTPATDVQLQTVAALLNDYGQRYGIPRDGEHLIMHSVACAPIDPSYRSDARCTTINELVALCAGQTPDVLETYERRYVTRYNGTTVRQGPARSFAIVGTVGAGREFLSDSAKWGEEIDSSDTWIHLSSGAGFVHSSAVERVS